MIKIEERVQAFMDAEYEYKISDAAQEQFWNRTDKECWHIIKLRLIAWIIGLYLIILECPLGCVYDYVCRAFRVPLLPVYWDRGWLGEPCSKKPVDLFSSGGFDQIHRAILQ